MSGPDERDQLRQEAAERIVRSLTIGVAPDDDATIASWRRGSAAHEAAYADVQATWDAASELSDHPSYAELMGAPTLRERWVEWRGAVGQATEALRRPQRLAFGSLAIVIAASAAWVGIERSKMPDYQTQTAEIRDVPLADGSVVTLGARSTLDVDYSTDVRRVELASGEAFFSVSKDEARPFVVVAGDTSIRVIGTKFNVNYEEGRVRVSVLEGVVEVVRASGATERTGSRAASTAKVTLTAGQQAVDEPAFIRPIIQPVRVSNAGGWREGRLSYQDAALSDIIADANRYRPTEIRILAPSLAQERLTTSFKVSQIDQMLDQLPLMLPVEVQRNADGSVNLKPM